MQSFIPNSLIGICRTAVVSTVIILVLATVAGASEKSEPVDLGEVVVTSPAPDYGKVYDVVTLYEADFEAIGATTVDEALNLMPGMFTRRGGRGEAYLRMRGFRQREVSVLIDGMPIYSPWDGQIDMDQLPLDNVSKIVVTRGTASPLYGPNGMGGTVNIITRRPDDSYSRLELAAGDESTYRVSGAAALAWDDESLAVTVSRRKSDGFSLSDDFEPALNQTSDLRTGSWFDKNAVSLKYSNNYGAANYSINFQGFYNEKALPPEVGAKNATFKVLDDWYNHFIDFTSDWNLNERNTIRTKVYRADSYYSLMNYVDDTYTTLVTPGKKSSQFDEEIRDIDSLGVVLHGTHVSARGDIVKWGLDIKRDKMRSIAKSTASATLVKTSTMSLAAEAEIAAGNRLSVTPGAAFHVFNPYFADGLTTGRRLDGFDPQIGISYIAGTRSTLNVSFAKKRRFPNLRDLYDSNAGNVSLSAQKSDNLQFNWNLATGKSSALDISIFRYDISDMIQKPSRKAAYANIVSTKITGSEIVYAGVCFDGPKCSIGYTYLDAEDESPATTISALQYRPKNTLNLRMYFDLPHEWQLNLSGQYLSTQVYYDDNNNIQSIPPITVINMNIKKKIHNNSEAFVTLKNILDKNYEKSDGFPAPGFTWRTGFSYNFN